MNKRIAVFTSIRSEYGVLTPVLNALRGDDSFLLELIVGGAHLSNEYGLTINKILEDGFEISERIDFLKLQEGKIDIPLSMSILTQSIGEYFENQKPDMLLVLGDRFELLPVVNMALIYNIPIAHLSGGEVTIGAIDNQVRNAITKMASLHFVATDDAQNNLRAMKEEEWRIMKVGEPFLDLINQFNPIPKDELYNQLGLNPDKEVVLVTFHPETINNKITPEFIKNFLQGILREYNIQILITASNFDIGGDEINLCIEQLASVNDNIIYIKSLGQKRYYSVLCYCKAVIGNSSSGIIEVQSFGKPVLNIGDRQKGRLSNPNVFNCQADAKIAQISFGELFNIEFTNKYKGVPNLYGDGNTALKIIRILKETDWEKLLIK